MITPEKLEKYKAEGRPLSNEDPNIVKGTGPSEDCPTGLPQGSYLRGRPICGATTGEDLPCLGKPLPSGRCHIHTNLQKTRKKTEKSLYSSVLTDDERTHQRLIKIGSLEEEIRLFKTILARTIKDGTIREITSIGHLICELEEKHHKLIGGAGETAFDLVIAMRSASKDIEQCVSQ